MKGNVEIGVQEAILLKAILLIKVELLILSIVLKMRTIITLALIFFRIFRGINKMAKDSTQDKVELSKVPNGQSTSDEDNKRKARIDFYKMEYEKGVQRHDDIYKSLWTNFSYMAVLAGGILTFGGDRLSPYLLGFLACGPLIFWYLATYIPLNAYGDQDARRLEEIEKIINKEYFGIEDNTQMEPPRLGLHNFSDFSQRKPKPLLRVRWVIHPFGVILILVVIYLFFMFIHQVTRTSDPVFYRKPADIKIDPADLKRFLESQSSPTPSPTVLPNSGNQPNSNTMNINSSSNERKSLNTNESVPSSTVQENPPNSNDNN